MFEPDSHQALVAVPAEEWRPILQAPNQVVLYNPTSHALSIRTAPHDHPAPDSVCPYCNRPLPLDSEEPDLDHVANYFQLLEVSNDTHSRPPSPPGNSAFAAESMAQGYFKTFFQEECRLGMGANGIVFLCQVRPVLAVFTEQSISYSPPACAGWQPAWLAISFVLWLRHQ